MKKSLFLLLAAVMLLSCNPQQPFDPNTVIKQLKNGYWENINPSSFIIMKQLVFWDKGEYGIIEKTIDDNGNWIVTKDEILEGYILTFNSGGITSGAVLNYDVADAVTLKFYDNEYTKGGGGFPVQGYNGEIFSRTYEFLYEFKDTVFDGENRKMLLLTTNDCFYDRDGTPLTDYKSYTLKYVNYTE